MVVYPKTNKLWSLVGLGTKARIGNIPTIMNILGFGEGWGLLRGRENLAREPAIELTGRFLRSKITQ
jgi:hypothetical protein